MQDQTPNTDPIQEQQEPIFTEIQHPDMPMKWHKFLIYFLLWFWAAANIYTAVDYFSVLGSGGVITTLTEYGTYWTYKFSALPVLWIAFIGCIVMAVYSIKVRFDLAKFKKGAPKKLSILYGIIVGLIILECIFYASNGGTMGADVPMRLAANIVQIFACRKYYQARDFMFVN